MTNAINIIMTRLEEIENALFMLEMVDRWTYFDKKNYDMLIAEKRNLRNELRKLEG